MRPVRALTAKVLALYESVQPSGEDPMVDFDERDLLRAALKSTPKLLAVITKLASRGTWTSLAVHEYKSGESGIEPRARCYGLSGVARCR